MIIDKTTWDNTQKAEINEHSLLVKDHYMIAYKILFKYFDLEFPLDLEEESILEVGPAFWGALSFCINGDKYVIDPMDFPTQILENYKNNNVKVIKGLAEEAELPKVNHVWLFNVLRHVLDPNLMVQKLKECSKTIWFFEPLGGATDACHPHSFVYKDFTDWFGEDNTKLYHGGERHFHSSECAYGVYNVK